MKKVIRIEDAKIKTPTISVKTLSIGTKQVTLAVFRQLIEEELIDTWTGQFNGLPWGVVNYHPDKTCENFYRHGIKHLHVVWQKGDELRRACVGKFLLPSEHCRIEARENELKGVFDKLKSEVHLLWIFANIKECIKAEVNDPVWVKHGNNSVKLVFTLPSGDNTFYWGREPDIYPENDPPYWNSSLLPRFFGDDWQSINAKPFLAMTDRKDSVVFRLDELDESMLDKNINAYWNFVMESARNCGIPFGFKFDLSVAWCDALLDQIKTKELRLQKESENRRIEYSNRYDELESLDQLFIAV